MGIYVITCKLQLKFIGDELESSSRSCTSVVALFALFCSELCMNSWILFIVDPRLASYGVENPLYAVIQLAQTTMRSELGKITLDKTFEERDTLNDKIAISINDAAKDWGLKCLRYEIRDISPPRGVRAAMEMQAEEMQAEAERKRRAQVLELEESAGMRPKQVFVCNHTSMIDFIILERCDAFVAIM
ncbi:hypothetical protein LOK49_Contig34G00005 [Camellia lanceoleosa]|nr:hypothetical protein LOK49_Contig34G00005 [Camellia lanceoleosa]